jgi:flagellin-like hook-associated protein FlgL
MSIAPFNASTYLSDRNTANLVGLKGRLDTLTNQLSSGKVAPTYGGLGAGRTTSLSAHAALSALDGYDAAITTATTRVTLANASVTQINTLGDGLQRSLTASNNSTIANTPQVARNSLDAAVDALNVDLGGQYIFGGRATDSPPVVAVDTILNGDVAKDLDGLKTLIAEQKTADLGTGTGRVGATVTGTPARTVTIGEEGTGPAGTEARANFGFRLLSATSSNPAAILANDTKIATAPPVTFTLTKPPAEGDRLRIAINQPDGTQSLLDLTATTTSPTGGLDTMPVFATATEAQDYLNTRFSTAKVASIQGPAALGVQADFGTGTPASLDLDVKGTPVAGDTVTVSVALRDGTTQTLTLTARASADPASTTEFSLAGTPEAIANSLSNAVTNALKGAASTSLAASSAARASQDFFAGSQSAGLAPRRVSADGNGYAEAASTQTVIWYTGDDSSSDPRGTATAQISANRVLSIGVQANEAPIRAVLAGLAMVAADPGTAAVSGTPEAQRFSAVADHARTLLTSNNTTGGVPGISSDLSLAASTLSETKTDNRTSRAALQGSLDGVENISAESVTAQLLQLQTQLQASYQVTSMLSKLNLVNYLS